jgi:hypothetical protein
MLPLLMMALDDATKTMPIRVPRMDGRGIATVSAAAVQPYRIAPCSTVPSSAAQLEGPGTIRADLCTLEHRSATKVLFVCLFVCLFALLASHLCTAVDRRARQYDWRRDRRCGCVKDILSADSPSVALSCGVPLRHARCGAAMM